MPVSLQTKRARHARRFKRFLRTWQLKQSTVARDLGVSSSYVCDIAGGRKVITATSAKAMELLYGISADWLRGRVSELATGAMHTQRTPILVYDALQDARDRVAELEAAIKQREWHRCY
jgi:predicted XRE-type DNA-binding protein